MRLKKLLIDFCNSNELRYEEDYSGKSMFGRTCFGIVCDDPLNTLAQLCDYLRDTDFITSAYDALGVSRIDSMGLSRILYFPNISFD